MLLRHIIWDWNGTLLDDTQASINAINALLAMRDLPRLDLPTYRERFGFPVRNFYQAVGFQLDQENWDALARDFHDRFLADPSLRLHADAPATLERCRQAGFRQSILSASEQSMLIRLLDTFEIAHHFDAVYGLDNQHGRCKLERGRDLMRQLRLDPAHALLVGDSLHDHEVARALGLPCVLLSAGHQSRARLARTDAPVLDRLADLPGWLRERLSLPGHGMPSGKMMD